jgi:hypothetical protein
MQALNMFPVKNKSAKYKGINNVWWLYGVFHIIYTLLYFLIWTRDYSATCKPDNIVPTCFVIANGMFIFNYFFALFMHYVSDFHLEWPQVQGKDHERFNSKIKSLFNAQRRRFLCWYTTLVILVIMQMIASRAFSESSEAVSCSHDGKRWIVEQWQGVFIFATHVLPSMWCAAMPRVVFIKAAKEAHMFS